MKKRITINESDRERILSLHTDYKKRLAEQAVTTTNNATATERFKTATCAGMGKGGRCQDKALQVQIKINDKCPSDKLPVKLVEDGIWGPKSTKAFTACGGSISGSETTTQTSGPAAAQQPTGQATTGQATTGQPTGGETATSSETILSSEI